MADEQPKSAAGDGAPPAVAPMEGVSTAEKEAPAPAPAPAASAAAESADSLKAKEKALFGSDDEDDALLNKPYGGAEEAKAAKGDSDDEKAKKKDESSGSSSSSSKSGAANGGGERAEGNASGGEEAPASPQPQMEEEEQRPVARRRREVAISAPEELKYWDQPEPSKNANLQFVKLPSYCQIAMRPYSRDTYEEEAAPETVIRYRKVRDEHGGERVESNARLVRWSDGSTSLLIGDGEALQATAQDVTRDQNFLYSLHPSFVLRCHSKVTTKLNVVAPEGSKALQQLSRNLQQVRGKEEHKKQAKIFAPTLDPEKDSEQRIKQEQDRIRTMRKLENKRAAKEDAYMRSGRLTANFLEGEEGDEEGNIGRIRDAFRRGADVRRGEEEEEEEEEADFEDEEEEELEEEEAERRILAAKSADPSQARKRGRAAEEEELVLADERRAEKKEAKEREPPAAAAAAERKRKGHVLEDDDG